MGKTKNTIVNGEIIYEKKIDALKSAVKYAETLKSKNHREDFIIRDGNWGEILDEFGKIHGQYPFIYVSDSECSLDNPNDTFREFYYEG